MDWIEALTKAVESDEDTDRDDEMDGEDEGDEEEAPPKRRMEKSTKSGDCPPAPNGDDDTDEEEAKVHDPKSLDRRSGGGPVSLKKSVTEETQGAIDMAPVLADLVKGVESLANQGSSEVLALAKRITRLEKSFAKVNEGLEAIGGALVKSLGQNDELLKSVATDVERIGRQPAPRRSTIRKVEKSFAGNEGTSNIPAKPEMLAKSLAGCKAGIINAQDAARLEAHYNQGQWAPVAPIWERIKGL